MSEVKIEGLKIEAIKEEVARGVIYTTPNGAQFSILRVEGKRKCLACDRGRELYEIFGYGSAYPKDGHYFSSLETAVTYLRANREKITRFFNWKKKMWEARFERASKRDIITSSVIRFLAMAGISAPMAIIFLFWKWPLIVKRGNLFEKVSATADA